MCTIYYIIIIFTIVKIIIIFQIFMLCYFQTKPLYRLSLILLVFSDILLQFTTERIFFFVKFDKLLCAMRHTRGKMFPRIAKCIIYHATHHLFPTFKMLLQYLELQIIHVDVINKVKNPTNGKKYNQFQDMFEQNLYGVTSWAYSCRGVHRSANFIHFGNNLSTVDLSLQHEPSDELSGFVL